MQHELLLQCLEVVCKKCRYFYSMKPFNDYKYKLSLTEIIERRLWKMVVYDIPVKSPFLLLYLILFEHCTN